MRGFENLLVPLDFSELSEATMDATLRVLAPGGKATLLHVVEWLPVVTEGAFGVYPHRKDIEQFKELSKERLEALASEHAAVNFELTVREGRPSRVILEVAQQVQPDLIVIGSHGRSGLDHFLLGSVTERVLRKAPYPVLVARLPVPTE